MNSYPDFCIIGAPKCGTTALHRWLSEHPDVFMPQQKEPHFFSGFRGHGLQNEADYAALFQDAREGQITGEASVWYLYCPEALERLKAWNPDVKLIVSLRNPADMLPSLHNQLVFSFRESVENFARAWQVEPARHAGRHLPDGCIEPRFLYYRHIAAFADQLERAQSLFGPERLLVLFQEDMQADPAAMWAKTLDFLGLDDDGRSAFPRVNEARQHRFPALSRFLKHPPWPFDRVKNGTKRMLGLDRRQGGQAFYALNAKPARKQPVCDALRLEIMTEMLDQTRRLEALTGRDLSAWKPGSAKKDAA